MEDPTSQNEAFIKDNKVEQVEDPFGKVPFQSIGILKSPSGYGTAQLLKDKLGCKYLITCAHNFIGPTKNNVGLKGFYTFELPTLNTHKPLRYIMQKVANFKIKEVYIPKEYSAYFDPISPVQYNKTAIFPALGPNIPELPITDISIKTYYDIAIIELESRLTETHGRKTYYKTF